MKENLDQHTVDGFGYEWTRFDQSDLLLKELKEIFGSYFSIFSWSKLPNDAVGFNLGCGSRLWQDVWQLGWGRYIALMQAKMLCKLPEKIWHI